MENRDLMKKGIYVANIGMDEAPHLTRERIDAILEYYDEYDARRYGRPNGLLKTKYSNGK